jgi:hypothetical protein
MVSGDWNETETEINTTELHYDPLLCYCDCDQSQYASNAAHEMKRERERGRDSGCKCVSTFHSCTCA